MAQTYTKIFANSNASFEPIEVNFFSRVEPIVLNVTVADITTNTAVITWTTPVPTTYEIDFKDNICPPVGCNIKTTTLATAHSVTVNNLTPNTIYKFVVRAITSTNESVSSSDITFLTKQLVLPTPPPPILPKVLSYLYPSYEWNIQNEFNRNFVAGYAVNLETEYVKVYFSGTTEVYKYDASVSSIDGLTGAPLGKSVNIRIPLPNEIGKFEMALVPGNSIVGDGEIVRFQLNIVKEFTREQPDITYIQYPREIREPDFSIPFNYNFDFKLTYVNTDGIEIFTGEVNEQSTPLYTRNVGDTNVIDINIPAQELYNVAPTAFVQQKSNTDGNDYYFLTFTFRPFFNGTSGKVYGKLETVTVSVKLSFYTLNDTQVVDSIVSKLSEIFYEDYAPIIDFENDRYLKYHLKYQNSPFDSYVISNIAKDDLTYSYTGELNNKGVWPGQGKYPLNWKDRKVALTEFEVDPDTGNTIRKGLPYPTLVVKLSEPLPGNIELNTPLWVSKQLIPSIIEDILINDKDEDVCISLSPNFNIDVLQQSGYEYYGQIVASGSVTSTDIANRYLSQSAFSLEELSIDYTSGSVKTDSNFLKFENFINFGGAKTRIENYQYKLDAIQFWQNKITSSLYIGSTPSTSSYSLYTSQSYLNKINDIKNAFDDFEKKMYTEYSITSSADTFFTYQSEYADEYDRFNKNYLVRHLPSYLNTGLNGNENQEFILFMEMIGQHFDVLWSYINGIHRAKIIRQNPEDGIPDKLVFALLENLGWDGMYPFDGYQLWKEAFGLNYDGTQFTYVNRIGTATTSSYTPEDARMQLWRRLLNNIPYLLKHKGTKRSIYAIMSCYGIPQSLMTISEFSGASSGTLTTTTKVENYTYTSPTAQLNVVTSSNVSIPYVSSYNPNAIQVRFATDYKIPTSTSITGSQLIRKTTNGSADYWQVNLIPSFTGSFGTATFIIGTASPSVTQSVSITSSVLFDNYWKNLTIQKEPFVSESKLYDRFTLYIKEASTDRLIMNQSASLILTASALTSVFTSSGLLTFNGSGSIKGISGSIDEIRIWNTALSSSVLDAHALNPDTIYGNTVYATTDNLLARLDFEYPKDRVTDPYIKNVSPSVTFSGSVGISGYSAYATASMAYTATSYPYHYRVYDRVATTKVPVMGFVPSDKVRLQTQELIGKLSYNQRVTKKTNQTNAIDSNKLGIFFSPIKELNLDILNSIGQINIGDYIGSWDEEYGTDSYRDLKALRSYYFKRTNLNFGEYIKLVKSVDASFFEMIKQVVPQRTKLLKGVLIEPSILDRSKIRINRPTADNSYHTASIGYLDGRSISAEDSTLSVVFDSTDFSQKLDSEYIYFTSSISNKSILNTIGEIGLYTSSISLNKVLNLVGNTTYNLGSNGGSIEANINTNYRNATIIAEYDLEQSYQSAGNDPDSPFVKGFGVYGEQGAVDRTYRRYDGSLVLTERSNAYIVTVKYTRDVPNTNISGITTYEEVARYSKKLLFVSQSDANAGGAFRGPSQHSFYTTIVANLGTYPYDKGVVTSIELFNGYTTGHYRFTKDLTKGLENSRFNGSKQTSLTTLDGAPAVEIFSTNPNVLKVNNTGRGSGEPILEVT